MRAILNLKIEGGKKLSGTIRVNSSKNGAVGLLCASLLNEGSTRLKNMPRIEEVYRIIEILESIGVNVRWRGRDVIITSPKTLKLKNIDEEIASKTRSIIMFLGPLLHLARSFTLPKSGGCKLGLRTVRPHVYAFETLGITISENQTHFIVKHSGLKRGSTIILYEAGDTVTENAIMAAARIAGTTTIKYASANYQVQELCFFLEKLGIKVEGVGTTTLVVHGKPHIKKSVEYCLSEDPTDAMFFIAAALVTKSSITIERCPIDFLELELSTLSYMGFKYNILRRYKSQNKKNKPDRYKDIHFSTYSSA